MTAEHIHDALTLLPADLIAEADKKRCRKPRVIPWTRYASFAACFVLVCASGWFCMQLFAPKGATETALQAPAEAAPMDQNANSFLDADTAQKEAAAEAPAAMQKDICGLPTAPANEEGVDESAAATASGSGWNYAGMSPPRYVEAIPASSSACFTGEPKIHLFRSPEDLAAYQDQPIHQFDPSYLLEECSQYDEAWFENHDLLLVTLCGVPEGELPEILDIRHYESQWKIVVKDYRSSTDAPRQDWYILIGTEKDLIAAEEALLATAGLSGEDIFCQRVYTPEPEKDASHTDVPETLLLNSREELDAYFSQYASLYDFRKMQEACAVYDDAWFASHDLLLTVIRHSHPDTPWEIVDITVSRRWGWEVLVSHHGTFYPGQENDSIHLLAELEKEVIPPEDSIIRITQAQPGS